MEKNKFKHMTKTFQHIKSGRSTEVIGYFQQLPKPSRPIQQIRFITSYRNPLYIGNIQPGHPTAPITKAETTERNITHNLRI